MYKNNKNGKVSNRDILNEVLKNPDKLLKTVKAREISGDYLEGFLAEFDGNTPSWLYDNIQTEIDKNKNASEVIGE